MKISAKLKIGKLKKARKSVTFPRKIRSHKFPAAPEKSKIFAKISGREFFFWKKKCKKISKKIVKKIKKNRGNSIENAIPEFSTNCKKPKIFFLSKIDAPKFWKFGRSRKKLKLKKLAHFLNFKNQKKFDKK